MLRYTRWTIPLDVLFKSLVQLGHITLVLQSQGLVLSFEGFREHPDVRFLLGQLIPQLVNIELSLLHLLRQVHEFQLELATLVTFFERAVPHVTLKGRYLLLQQLNLGVLRFELLLELLGPLLDLLRVAPLHTFNSLRAEQTTTGAAEVFAARVVQRCVTASDQSLRRLQVASVVLTRVLQHAEKLVIHLTLVSLALLHLLHLHLEQLDPLLEHSFLLLVGGFLPPILFLSLFKRVLKLDPVMEGLLVRDRAWGVRRMIPPWHLLVLVV